jgi:hypothetical protein
VLGVLGFEVQAPIMRASFVVFSGWLFLVNRWLRGSARLGWRIARLGERLGASTLAGAAIVGLGFVLPWQWLRLAVSGVGALLVVLAMLGIPIWFLRLGRHLDRAAQNATSNNSTTQNSATEPAGLSPRGVDGYSGSLAAAPPTVNGVVTPWYIRWVTSPSRACGRLWQWSIQMPGLSATKAMS